MAMIPSTQLILHDIDHEIIIRHEFLYVHDQQVDELEIVLLILIYGDMNHL